MSVYRICEIGQDGAVLRTLIEISVETDNVAIAYAERLPLTGRVIEVWQQEGLSGFLCEAGYPSCVHEALVEHDGELGLRLGPFARRAFPFRGSMVQDQI